MQDEFSRLVNRTDDDASGGGGDDMDVEPMGQFADGTDTLLPGALPSGDKMMIFY